MPLHKIIHHSENTSIYIWKIQESYDELISSLTLQESSRIRISQMKSKTHQLGFMSVRKLLNLAGYQDSDLNYNEDGKPTLNDNKYISITHSFEYAAIIISDKSVGIDIEMQRDKVIKIANKFTSSENLFLSKDTLILTRELTIIWTIKEALYKLISKKGLSFKENINVNPFKIEDSSAIAKISYGIINQEYLCKFEELDNFTLAYAICEL